MGIFWATNWYHLISFKRVDWFLRAQFHASPRRWTSWGSLLPRPAFPGAESKVMRSGGPEVNSEQLKKDKSRCLVYDIMYVIICLFIYIYICVCNNGNGADNSNDDANNNHHADVYYIYMCIYSYIHCYSGVCRDHCSPLWLYTKCCDVQNHRHGNPKLSPGDVITHRKNSGTITTNWVWELQNGSVIEIALGLPKPFFTMGF